MRYHLRNLRKSWIVISIITVTLGQPMQALALSRADDVFYSDNDILFYNPGQCTTPGTTTTPATGSTSLIGNTNAEKIWTFLVSKGLTAEQAAGVMGNIRQESNYNPDARESNGIGYGIVQWSYQRRTALETAAARQGVLASDLAFQLEYMYQESNSRRVSSTVAAQGYGTAGANEWETLKQQSSIEDATVFWHNNFEVSADTPEQVLKNRGAYAREAYNSFKDMTPANTPPTTAGTTPASGSNCTSASSATSSFGGGDLLQTTLAYAWPEYHAPDYTTKKPEYAAAIQKAQSEGRFVGGGEYPGVDCGGFVTTLMLDSGFEPRYNSNGKGGNTVFQEVWLKDNWKVIGTGPTINSADLRPGDVAMLPGHTFVYVGDIPGFNSKVASSSYAIWRAPMAGIENVTDPKITWYRKA